MVLHCDGGEGAGASATLARAGWPEQGASDPARLQRHPHPTPPPPRDQLSARHSAAPRAAQRGEGGLWRRRVPLCRYTLASGPSGPAVLDRNLISGDPDVVSSSNVVCTPSGAPAIMSKVWDVIAKSWYSMLAWPKPVAGNPPSALEPPPFSSIPDMQEVISSWVPVFSAVVVVGSAAGQAEIGRELAAAVEKVNESTHLRA